MQPPRYRQLKVGCCGEGDFDKVRIKKVSFVATGGREVAFRLLPSTCVTASTTMMMMIDDDYGYGGLAY